MKHLPSFLTVIGLSCCTTLYGQTTLLQDNFDSYTTGPLPASGNWPASIPGSSNFWNRITGGSQAIIDGSAAGRSGNLFHYTENAASQVTTYSSTQLTTPYSGDATWSLSIDFYIDDFAFTTGDKQLPSVFSVVGLYGEGGVSDASRITAFSISRNSSTGLIQASMTRTAGSTFFTGNLQENQWYTLTITGDFSTQTMSATIQGASLNLSLSDLAYTPTSLATVAIGDVTPNAWKAGRSNSFYLDNMVLATIPEPSGVALFGASSLLLALGTRLRGNRKARL